MQMPPGTIEILPFPPERPCRCQHTSAGPPSAIGPCLEPPDEHGLCGYCTRYHQDTPSPHLGDDLVEPEDADGEVSTPWWISATAAVLTFVARCRWAA